MWLIQGGVWFRTRALEDDGCELNAGSAPPQLRHLGKIILLSKMHYSSEKWGY